MSLPEWFCWSRFGPEAGQDVHQILSRKEQERVANGGIFFWGIGNAIGPSMRKLLQRTRSPELLLSPIKSRRQPMDATAPAVVAWTSAVALRGEAFRLPACSLITSRYDPLTPKTTHFALVCSTDDPLDMSGSSERVEFAALRNLLSGRPVGASQVTAVVVRGETPETGAAAYPVAIRAKLVYPYFLQLRHPVLLSSPDSHLDYAVVIRMAWEQRVADQKVGTAMRLSFPGV